MAGDNASKHSSISSPGEPKRPGRQTHQRPDKGSPYQGGEKIHGDKLEHDPGNQNPVKRECGSRAARRKPIRNNWRKALGKKSGRSS